MSTIAQQVTDEPVLLRHDNGAVCTLTMNRPRQFNALSEAMLDALEHALAELADDQATKVVVLAGNGRAFCAGHDLKEMRQRPREEYYRALFERCSDVMQGLIALPKPVIARVHGIATAAGCQLVAACDLAVAAKEARFAVSGVNLGLFCSTPSVALSRNVLRKKAFEMLVTGDFIDADTAVDYGLVNRAVPGDALDNEIEALTDAIAAKPRVALETGKRVFYRQLELPLADAYRYAGEAMACNMTAPDTAEGVDAFIEKRAPSWKR